jgi:hypothetical protein
MAPANFAAMCVVPHFAFARRGIVLRFYDTRIIAERARSVISAYKTDPAVVFSQLSAVASVG